MLIVCLAQPHVKHFVVVYLIWPYARSNKNIKLELYFSRPTIAPWSNLSPSRLPLSASKSFLKILTCFHSPSSSHHLSPPEIIITNQEMDLMNSIKQVWPNKIHILCTWQIKKKILPNVFKIIKNYQEVEKIMPHWSSLVKISTPRNF